LIVAKYKDELLDHDYDGIRELDNDLPRWWQYLFYITIIWSVLYMLYYHVFNIGYLQEDQYRREMNPSYLRAQDADGKLLGMLSEYRSPYHNPYGDDTPRSLLLAAHGDGPRMLVTRESDTVTYVAVIDPGLIAAGRESFEKVCAQCHGKLGEGGVGPNLTDNYWLHGADITSVVKSVKYGYPAKGMIPWRGTLSEDELINVSSYVLTLRGTNPPNAKAPQGDPVSE
jgi:cytochrome c oxidase cbb3-type subunit 3